MESLMFSCNFSSTNNRRVVTTLPNNNLVDTTSHTVQYIAISSSNVHFSWGEHARNRNRTKLGWETLNARSY